MSDIDANEFRRWVLEFLRWDDDMWLREPIRWLNMQYGDVPWAECQAVAAQVLRELHAEGLIELYRWSDEAAGRNAAWPALPDAEAEAEIAASHRPMPPGTDVWIRLADRNGGTGT